MVYIMRYVIILYDRILHSQHVSTWCFRYIQYMRRGLGRSGACAAARRRPNYRLGLDGSSKKQTHETRNADSRESRGRRRGGVERVLLRERWCAGRATCRRCRYRVAEPGRCPCQAPRRSKSHPRSSLCSLLSGGAPEVSVNISRTHARCSHLPKSGSTLISTAVNHSSLGATLARYAETKLFREWDSTYFSD